MKTLKAALLAGLILVAGAAQAAEPREKYHRCNADIDGANGSSVSVSINFNLDGSPKSRTAVWTPPSEQVAPRLLTVMVFYDEPTEQGIGPVDNVTVMALMRGTPMLKDADVKFDVGGGKSWGVKIIGDPPSVMSNGVPISLGLAFLGNRGDKPINTDLLDAMGSFGRSTVTVTSVQGVPIAGAVYDLGARAERDAMFAQAWAKAAKAAEKPKRCKKTD